MNDQIHAARWVAKAHTASPAAFTSPGFGPLGHIAEGQVYIPLRLRERSPLFSSVPRRKVRVGPVTIALGDDDVLIDAVADHVEGLVVAVFGVGHVPAGTVTSLAKLAGRMPVVLVSRTGSETDLFARGLISAGYLAPFKARFLLYLLIATGADRTQIRQTFAAASGVS